MGNNICQTVQKDDYGILERKVDASPKSFYQPFAIEQAPYLQNRIEELLKNNEDLRSHLEGKELLKHQSKDLFYYGQWNSNDTQKGKGIQYKTDDYLYYGDFDALFSGKGVYQSLTQKFIYEGDFNSGKIEGKGKIYSTQNHYSFEGQFNKESQPVTGTATINSPQSQSKSYTVKLNNYPQNKAKIIYNDGRQYQGQISYKNLAPQGTGRAHFINGSIYEGKWQNGQYNGEGKFIWTDGSSYEGQYQHGKKQGLGTFHYASKKYYQGSWQNGIQNGEGTLFSQDGAVLKKGFWVNGVFDRKIQQ